MMGGSIEMLSTPGMDTAMSFNLSLPIADPAQLSGKAVASAARPTGADPGQRAATSLEQAAREGRLVLVVDDHPTNRLVLIRLIQVLGYAVETANNGSEALQLWLQGRFGLILTDCNMPEMSGYQLTRAVRQHEDEQCLRHTPIIGCTANALRGEAETCLAAGMDSYLAKPVQLAELREKLEQWLPPAAAIRAEPPQLHSPEPAASAGCPIDYAVLAESLGGDVTAGPALLSEFQRVNERDMQALEQVLANRDSGQLGQCAHRIKGACKIIGALALAEACVGVEQASRADDWAAIDASMLRLCLELHRLSQHLQQTSCAAHQKSPTAPLASE